MILDVVAAAAADHLLFRHVACRHEPHQATCCRAMVGYLHQTTYYRRMILDVAAVDNDGECGDEADHLLHYVNVELT